MVRIASDGYATGKTARQVDLRGLGQGVLWHRSQDREGSI